MGTHALHSYPFQHQTFYVYFTDIPSVSFFLLESILSTFLPKAKAMLPAVGLEPWPKFKFQPDLKSENLGSYLVRVLENYFKNNL